MSSSFTFKHNATKVKETGWFGSILFDSQAKTPVSKVLYPCLASNSTIWVDKRKESLETQFFCQHSQVFLWYLTVMQTLPLCIQTILLLFQWLSDPEALPIGQAVNQNYVFGSFSIRSNWKQFPRLIDQTCWRDSSYENP